MLLGLFLVFGLVMCFLKIKGSTQDGIARRQVESFIVSHLKYKELGGHNLKYLGKASDAGRLLCMDCDGFDYEFLTSTGEKLEISVDFTKIPRSGDIDIDGADIIYPNESFYYNMLENRKVFTDRPQGPEPGALVGEEGLLGLLDSLKEHLGLIALEVYPIEFGWSVEGGEKLDIVGYGLEIGGVTVPQKNKIESFFGDQGFEIDYYNAADGTVVGQVGYRSGLTVCVVRQSVSGGLVEGGSDVVNVEVLCGELSN